MARCGKLTKLKSSVMKKLTSFGRNSNSSSSIAAAATATATATSGDHGSVNNNRFSVYVGKSRRRYLVDSKTVNNPIFRELVERSSSPESEEDAVVIECEVVLFEHLLWMLHNNASAAEWQVTELVEFYAC